MELKNKTILVTGCAGFIGANLIKTLFRTKDSIKIIGIDNLCNYYDVGLKEYRLREIENSVSESKNGCWHFEKADIADRKKLTDIFERYRPTVTVNLAAQAGVRYSIINPYAYIESNIVGFFNVLDCCKTCGVSHFVYASSSSVYGDGAVTPFSEDDSANTPVSVYAATKKSDELLAFAYSKLHGIPSTGLRFFTVYGPAGRPDMAYYSFADKFVRGEKIKLYNFGNCKRDFTYIDDTVNGIIKVMESPPQIADGKVPHEIYNLGNNKPENLNDFVQILAEKLKKEGVLSPGFDLSDHIETVGMQLGDVTDTYADMTKFCTRFGFKPATDLRQGLGNFAAWYKKYYFG